MATTYQEHGDRQNFRSLLDARRRQIADDLQLRIARIRENGSNAKPVQEPARRRRARCNGAVCCLLQAV